MAGDRVFQQQRHLQAGGGQVGGSVLDTRRSVQVGGQDQRQELPRVHGQEAARPRPLHQQKGLFDGCAVFVAEFCGVVLCKVKAGQ